MGIREDDKRYDAYVSYRLDLINYASLILGSRDDAEDVVQEAFIKFVPEQASNPSTLKSYLFRIVRNLALDSRRRRRHDLRLRPDDTPFWGLPQEHPTPEGSVLFCDELRQVQAVLSRLPVEARVAMEMHRFGGYKMEEIAKHLGVSVASVHRLIKAGVVTLAEKTK